MVFRAEHVGRITGCHRARSPPCVATSPQCCRHHGEEGLTGGGAGCVGAGNGPRRIGPDGRDQRYEYQGYPYR